MQSSFNEVVPEKNKLEERHGSICWRVRQAWKRFVGFADGDEAFISVCRLHLEPCDELSPLLDLNA